jgi:hypothetical protein
VTLSGSVSSSRRRPSCIPSAFARLRPAMTRSRIAGPEVTGLGQSGNEKRASGRHGIARSRRDAEVRSFRNGAHIASFRMTALRHEPDLPTLASALSRELSNFVLARKLIHNDCGTSCQEATDDQGSEMIYVLGMAAPVLADY